METLHTLFKIIVNGLASRATRTRDQPAWSHVESRVGGYHKSSLRYTYACAFELNNAPRHEYAMSM